MRNRVTLEHIVISVLAPIIALVLLTSCKSPTAPTPPDGPAFNSMRTTLFSPNGTPINEGDMISLEYGSSLEVVIEYSVSDEVWARRRNSEFGLSIWPCFGRSADTIVLYCLDGKKLPTQTGVITERATLPNSSPWNTVAQTLTQVSLMTEGHYKENGIGGAPESWLDFPISQLPVPLVQKTVIALTVNWTH